MKAVSSKAEDGLLAGARPKGGPSQGRLASLFDDPARLAVDRAIGELRSGRPVVLHRGKVRMMVAAAEALGGRRILHWRASTRATLGLILPAPRLTHLGLAGDGPCRLALDGLAAEDIDNLLFAAAPALPALHQRPASSIEALALALVKHAYLLPAALVLPNSDTADALALSVSAEAVATYHEQVARHLSIATRTRVPLADAEDAEFVVFQGGDGLRDQVAIIIGNPDPTRPVPVRLHSACLTGDLFGSLKCDCGDQLRRAVHVLSEAGGGVLLYLDQEGRGIGLRNKIRAYGLQELGHDTLDADAALGYGADERRYLIAARMLALLGLERVVLLTNSPDKIAALQTAGISVVAHRRLLGSVNAHNLGYLTTKARRTGHLLGELGQDGIGG